MTMRLAVASAALLGASSQAATADGYYREHPSFHFFPDPKAVKYEIQRLGPLGFGVELRQPAFTMIISGVEEGAPADKTGQLKKGQIVESINGEVLKDIDPRVQLGDLITQIEATDGIARLMVKDMQDSQAYPVEIKIPVMGPYSDTWPLNCRKSDTIVRNFALFLDRVDKPGLPPSGNSTASLRSGRTIAHSFTVAVSTDEDPLGEGGSAPACEGQGPAVPGRIPLPPGCWRIVA